MKAAALLRFPLIVLLAGVPGPAWAGLGDLVGVRVVEDMEIQLLMESPKEMVMPSGAMGGHGGGAFSHMSR